ncbi:hypothetical protein [Wenzhouxiangella limi]|nr:hypothetical protein [Wenzhouxiangella limi]
MPLWAAAPMHTVPAVGVIVTVPLDLSMARAGAVIERCDSF